MIRRFASCCQRWNHEHQHVSRKHGHVSGFHGHVSGFHGHVTSSTRGYVTNRWTDLDLHPALVQRLADVNFEHPTPIQARSIPHVIRGRHTICHAETGCGKTFCYLIPLVHRLLYELDTTDSLTHRGGKVQFLVFAPTPELGLQISQMFEMIRPPELGKVTPHLWEGLREGRSYVDTTSPFIITTFSKLRDYNYYQLFGHIPTIVLDEADVYHTGRLKSLTYRVLGELVDPFRYHKVSTQLPSPKQLVYVAATLNTFQKEGGGNNLNKWLNFHEISPVLARTGGVHDTPPNLTTHWRYVEEEDFTRSILGLIEQIYCSPQQQPQISDFVPEGYDKLDDIGVREDDVAIHIPEDLDPILDEVQHPDTKVLIFLNSADSVNILYRNLINYLKQSPCKSVTELARQVYRLSGSLTREERAAVVKRIGRGSVRILIASDIASRGLDIPDLDMVINAQLPVDSVGYLHRAGRTARMGKPGTVINLLSDYDVPLYNKIKFVQDKDAMNFNHTMTNPAKTTRLKSSNVIVEEEGGVRMRGKVEVDPWLKDNPAAFVSKIYRNDFEIK